MFLWPYSDRFAPFGASPPRMFSGAALSGVRTFLDPAKAEPRLPDQPEALSSYPPGAGPSTWGRDRKDLPPGTPFWGKSLRKHQGIGGKVVVKNGKMTLK